MSGSFGSAQWLYEHRFYESPIDQSLRFNDDDTAYLSRTPASAGNRKTWTWSGWVKRGAISSSGVYTLFTARNPVLSGGVYEPYTLFSFVNDELYFADNNGAISLTTNSLFRDPSAWYHIVLAVDTTQATSSDRVKIYVNGVQQTVTGTYLSQNVDTTVNSTFVHNIGVQTIGVQYFDGYMAEVNFIDGQALDPTSFGEFKSDVWIPKSYSGTYGTNGFYLPFNDADFLGKDNSTVLGSDLVTNGSFDADVSDWSLNGFCTTSWISSGKMQINRTGGSGPTAYQAITCEVGATYAIRVQLNSVGSRGDLRVNEAVGSGTILNLSGTNGSVVDISGQFTATQTTHYLQFYVDNGGTSIIVDDVSVKKIISQGNDWASVNLAVTDQVLDSPTNNFCTWNPLDRGDLLGLSEGSTEAAYTSGLWAAGKSTVGVTSGKWYWEVVKTTANYSMIGIGTTDMPVAGNTHPGYDAYSWAYYSDTGNKLNNNTSVSYGATYASGDVIGVAFDADAGSLTFYKNGVSQGVAYTGLTSGPYFPVIGVYLETVVANFGQDSSFADNKTAQGNTDANGIGDFYYAPPAGYLALCTANLPDPAIDPAQDDVPADYFNTVLYTGDGTTTRSITGVGFQPDLVWVKSRNTTWFHVTTDSVRGGGYYVSPNDVEAESVAGNSLVTGFNSDGFDVNVTPNGTVNGSGDNFVAWNWKAGGSGVPNTDGTIASTVSANQKAGFSIVSHTTTGGGAYTVGHGLGVKPDFIIMKSRSVDDNWYCWHKDIGSNSVFLNNTDAATSTSQWDSTDSSIISWSDGGSGSTYIAYCFHSVEGFSKFGSYKGNGSTDGPFVYTGFRPAFVMVKNASAAEDWVIVNTETDTYNATDKTLKPNSSQAEIVSTISSMDIVSNGIKLRTADTKVNGNGNTFIYMAFAEMPFRYANAR